MFFGECYSWECFNNHSLMTELTTHYKSPKCQCINSHSIARIIGDVIRISKTKTKSVKLWINLPLYQFLLEDQTNAKHNSKTSLWVSLPRPLQVKHLKADARTATSKLFLAITPTTLQMWLSKICC